MSHQISVVIATYNGEKYIREQLLSIYNQSVQPHEVLIFDDCSSDSTVEIISDFIGEFRLNNWFLVENPTNLGWKANFISGLSRASGDIVFPCDQDDIWDSEKINNMISIMTSNPSIQLLASSYEAFYENDSKNSKVVQKTIIGDNSYEEYVFSSHFMEVKRPGCCYAVSRELIAKALDIWRPDIAHDACLWRMAIIEDGLYLYNNSTMKYRRHSSNLTGLNNRNRSDITTVKSQIDNMLIAINAIIDYLKMNMERPNIKGKYDCACMVQKYLYSRYSYLSDKSLSRLIGAWFKYRIYYPSCKTLIWDLILVLGLK